MREVILPRAVIVMGVSGAGKSTLGRALAERLDYAFIEGDEFHFPSNIRKMAAGIPLDDEDRWPWLERIADGLAQAAESRGGVVACSALKRTYRDFIRQRVAVPVALIHPVMEKEALRRRLAQRKGHYMSVTMLDSQLEALQRPVPDERALTLAADLPVTRQVETALSHWSQPDRQARETVLCLTARRVPIYHKM